MTANRTLDLSHLRPYDISSEAPLWWGQLFMAIVECTMFAILIAMYFYIRLSMDMWPPPGIQIPELVLPSICVMLLILSCIGSYLASEAAKRGDRAGMIRGLVLNLALALAGMVARGINWGQWNFRWDVDAYGSIVWCIIFLHTFDIVADLVFTAVLVAILVSGRVGPKQRLAVHVDSVLWYFLVAIWVPLYVTIFWGPRIVGAR